MGKKSTKTKTTTTPWKPVQGDILGAVGTVRDTVSANQGNLDQLASDVRGFLPGLGARAFGESPLLAAGNQYATDVLGGKYLDQQNPYMQGMIDQTSNDVTDRINAIASKSGASLGTQHFGMLAKELANAQNSIRYGNYAQERQNQQGAAGLLPALHGSQFAGVPAYLSAAQTAGGLPLAGLGALSPIIGLGGGAGQTTGTQPGGWGTGLLGAAAMALPFIPGFGTSARAAKTKIEEIGLWDDRGDNLKKYRFAYKWAPDQMLEGVMAEEVAEKRPWALGPIDHRGYQTVNYAALSEAA